MKEIHEKLAVWARLSKECEQLRANLLRNQAQHDASSLAAEFEALQARTYAAFRDASEAIKRNERPRPVGSSPRSRQMALGG